MDIVKISRRDFLKTGVTLAGSGLLLGISCSPGKIRSKTAVRPMDIYDLNAFIYIGTDNTVTLIINKSEMGQGVYTSLPMLIAEELECEWDKIRIKPAPVAPIYNHTGMGTQLTGGSTSIPSEWERMRKVGATAREMLISAAVKIWDTNRTSCRAEKSMVIHKSGRKLSYGELAARASRIPVPEKVILKKASDFRLIGKSVLRLDTREKVNGRGIFGIDVHMPGILTAVIARPPVFGGKVKNVNSLKTKKIAGVRDVVLIESGVAVIADDFWSANEGRDALEIDWDDGPLASLSTKGIREHYAKLAGTPGAVALNKGNADKQFAAAKKKLIAEYEVPYLAHAMMEPLNCVIILNDNGCDIWTGTQSQTRDRDVAAKILGFSPDRVKLHTTLLGGGFGRRGNPNSDFVSEAAHVAKAAKKSVRVVWTREDDIKGGYYRPMWYDRISAGLNVRGGLTAWKHTIVGQSIFEGTMSAKRMIRNGIDLSSVEGASDIPYEIPNILVDLHSPATGIPVQWWRSVGHSHTGFVVESFIDEIARSTGRDPFRFRRDLLAKGSRHRSVLELAAKKAGWGKPVASGRGRGIAVHKSFGSFVAEVAEVSVNDDGEVRVHRVVCAVDCGRNVNPSIIEAQIESAVVFGLSAALYDEITLEKGRVVQNNFSDYPMLRINEMPVIEVHIIRSRNKPSGIGEPGVPPIAAAVTNAIFDVTGKRIRKLPINAQELKKA